MKLKLLRNAYLHDRTLGELYVGSRVFYTVERPWLPTKDHLGGTNQLSCIPDGDYDVKPYSSPKFTNVWCLINPGLDVYYNVPAGKRGRSRILIHVGNTVKDVIGCIAVGKDRSDTSVIHSRDAINELRSLLKNEDHTLLIRPKGAVNETMEANTS